MCPIWLPVFYFFSIIAWTRIGHFNQPSMPLKPCPSCVRWNEIWTHDLLIVNLACYPLDKAFTFDKFPCKLPNFFYFLICFSFLRNKTYHQNQQAIWNVANKKRFASMEIQLFPVLQRENLCRKSRKNVTKIWNIKLISFSKYVKRFKQKYFARLVVTCSLLMHWVAYK